MPVAVDIRYIREIYPQIIVIISPPRCSSTALARVFWEHPEVRYYAHEPFETTYYDGDGIETAIEKMASPLDLETRRIKRYVNGLAGSALLIKEMPYQVGQHVEELLGLATLPVIFLMRDPRLNIASRIEKKREVGDPPLFPLIETGWELLEKQVEICERLGKKFVLLDSRDFRNAPGVVLPRLFDLLQLPFMPDQVLWDAHPEVGLDNLGGRHAHLYGEVLESTLLLPDQDPIRPLDFFPEAGGFRRHVEDCLAIYARLRAHPARIR